MNLHLVGGFLGSGKTTAIIQAAKAWMDEGQRVGVITNDQGKYLVDTAFFRLSAIPAVEVTGGCFCCNYDDLDGRLSQLIAESQPDVIFAESVGSCADIVATVVKPLLQLGQQGVSPRSFTVFTDARLLRRRLAGQEMPFSEDVVYIFDKQIEEAGLLVMNKIDLLSEMAVEDLTGLWQERYPGKPFLRQSSLTVSGVRPWLDLLQTGGLTLPGAALEIDYRRYGDGEARLAWLDAEVLLKPEPGAGQAALERVIEEITRQIKRRGAGIGHLKFIIEDEQGGVKLSIPTLEEPGWQKLIPAVDGQVKIVVNARVEMPAEELRLLVRSAFQASGADFTIRGEAAFHPGQPNPTHRLS